jgi:hypothetical protein
MIPSTGGGKVVAGLICICGVLVLSIPVSVISQNFAVRCTCFSMIGFCKHFIFLNCAQYEFEESDRQKAKLRLKMGNRYGRTQNEALQPATILNAHKVFQLKLFLLLLISRLKCSSKI